MTTPLDTTGHKPVFRYDIPHGYLQLDLYPSAEHVDALARQVRELPDDIRDKADQAFRMYAIVISQLQSRRVQGCALGMHPDEQGGASLSVLTVSSVEMPGTNPKAVLAKLLEDDIGDNGVRPVELPCGPGFLLDGTHTTRTPGDPAETGEERVWQGTVAIPDTRNSTVIAVQLVTPTLDLADDYRNILLGVARTVTFTDPHAGPGTDTDEPAPGSAAAAVRDDFG